LIKTDKTEHYTRYCSRRNHRITNHIHGYFLETDSHLQTSQHQASLKHENLTVSYHKHTTLLTKNFCSYSYILVVHFTASTIWGVQKLGLVGMVGYHYMFLILKCL